MSLCQLCQSAPIFNLPKLELSTGLGYDNAYTERILSRHLKGASYPWSAGHDRSPPGFKHQAGLEKLRQSAGRCALCALIAECVRIFVFHINLYLEDDISRRARPFGLPESFQLWLAARDRDAPGFKIYTDSNKHNDIFEVGEVAFLSHEDDAKLRQAFPGQHIQNDLHFAKTLKRAAEWLDTCQKTHTTCRSVTGTLPTRILDIRPSGSDTDSVVLRDTIGEQGNYATLSYCWGTSGNVRTTTATVDDHRRGIETNSLPKTIRDAVTISRHLGLQYLWVDALCIIQDDLKDWEREAQAMARVYSNAFINISALGARDTSEGCLVERELHKGVVPLDFKDDSGACHQVFATIATQIEMGSLKRDLGGHPISERGWTLQERILARRTLHFGQDQMYFECGWGFQSEDGYSEPRNSQNSSLTLGDGLGERSRGNTGFFDNDMASSLFPGFQGWARLAGIFGTRQLTKASDKLPAYSGIVQRYEALLDDVYVAGLWKSRLIEDLLWSAESWYVPAQYRAPSWSWLSIDGPIHLPDMKAKKLGQKCATALDYGLEPKGDNPYGELLGGWLKIEAPLSEVQDGRIFGYDPRRGRLMVYVEVPEEEFDALRIFTLHLFKMGEIPWTALLITPIEDKPGQYRRVGKVTNMTDWKEDEIPEKQVVVLV